MTLVNLPRYAVGKLRLVFGLTLWLLMTLLLPAPVMAKHWQATPQHNLQLLLDHSQDGDTVMLSTGVYRGNFSVNHAITLAGEPGAVIDAQAKGHALELTTSGIAIKNLTVINWGSDLTAQNAGIYSDSQTSNIIISGNTLTGSGFGIWLQKADQVKVLNNSIEGDLTLRSADRGNGIQLSTVTHAEVVGNTIFHTRDGLYIISSQHNVLDGNTMHDLRYGIHYMYSHSNKVLNNLSYNTRAGYALMSSKNLIVEGNTSIDSEDYGFLMNFITSSTISNNRIKNVWTKPENKVLGRDGKGLFVYNSAYNTISNNVVDTAEIGIHLTAGSENTQVYGNSFIHNPTQVKYVSNKKQEWSFEQQGNYWSNYLGWDMNGDNVGDIAFEPNDGIDKLLWQYPEMKMIMNSPAVIILRWVQRQFPVLKPPGIKDSFPLMQSPHQPISASTVTTTPMYAQN